MGAALDYYYNKSKIWLPMKAENHDPTNPGAARTLDVSGNGNHALLGDGTTAATMPTKIQERGYSFDGSSDYLYTPWAPTPAGTMTVFFRGNTAGGLMGSYYATTGADRCYLWLNGGHLNGGIANQNLTIIAGTTSLNTDQWYFGAITWDGSTVVLVLDDNIEYTAAQVGAVPNTYPIAVGAVVGTFAPTTYHAGDVAQAVAFDWALSMPQLQDLKTLMYKQVNHV